MSGGIAYVFDEAGDFAARLNKEMVALTKLEDFDEEIQLVSNLIQQHAEYTGSKRAEQILFWWENNVAKFVRVIPHDYQRVLEAQAQMRAKGLSEEEAVMAAFELNARDAARVGGK
jgi:glutamate synthase (ferredoxin)